MCKMKELTKNDYAQMIDHTLLKADATYDDLKNLCEVARKYNFKTVCVNPSHIDRCAKFLKNSSVNVCTVIGFPLGANQTEVKVFEAESAIKTGAKEIDMVINIGALKSKDYDLVEKDIRALANVARKNNIILKVIIETALLTDDEKVKACELAKSAKAHFVKTSTGFAASGATVKDVALMKSVVGDELEVKASGGVKTLNDVRVMIEAGATRIGTSSGDKIVDGLEVSGIY